MKRLLALTIAFAAMTSSADAAPSGHRHAGATPATGASAHAMMMPCPLMEGHVEGVLAFLKTELQITGDQRKAWNAFAEVFKDTRTTMKHRMHGMMMGQQRDHSATEGSDSDSMKSFPDRLRAHIRMTEDQQVALRRLEAASNGLYDALDRDQKEAADKLLPMFTMMMH